MPGIITEQEYSFGMRVSLLLRRVRARGKKKLIKRRHHRLVMQSMIEIFCPRD